MKKAFLFLISTLLVCSCSKIDEMQGTTNKMSDTTTQMNDKMTETNKTTDKVLKVSKDTVKIVRPGGAVGARRDALDSMKRESSIPKKVGEAAKYFFGFEYQYWTADVDTSQHREELKGHATEEFFKDIRQFFTGHSFEFTNPFRNHSLPLSANEQNLYALSATLHEKDDFQIAAVSAAKVPETSMLDMIEEGLRSKDLINQGQLNGDQVSLATSTVLQNEENSVKLLQYRQSFLLIMAFCEMVDMGESWSTLVANTLKYEMYRTPIYGALESKNLIQVQWQNKYLRGSLRMRKLLLDLHKNADLEWGMSKFNVHIIYSKIDPLKDKSVFAQATLAVKNEIMRYHELLQLVLASDAEFLKSDKSLYACKVLDCDN